MAQAEIPWALQGAQVFITTEVTSSHAWGDSLCRWLSQTLLHTGEKACEHWRLGAQRTTICFCYIDRFSEGAVHQGKKEQEVENGHQSGNGPLSSSLPS